MRSFSPSHTHWHTGKYAKWKIKKHTREVHIHRQTLSMFFWEITQVPHSLWTTWTAQHKILLLYSAVTHLNYSRAGWISKREDKRPLSFWNRFCMFVLFPARSWAGSACEKYEVIMFRSMERIMRSHSPCKSFKHFCFDILHAVWACLSFISPFFLPPFCRRFTFFFIPTVYSIPDEINTLI